MIGALIRLISLAALAAATPCAAQSYDENPSGKAIFAQGDVRLTQSPEQGAWLDGGFGKTRFGDGTAPSQTRLRVVEGDLACQPQLSWALGATIAAVAQQGQDKAVDLSEAYLSWRPSPSGSLRLAARAGLMWPPISLEHSGPAWSVTETITPSAINSWVGEELKIVGAEATGTIPAGRAKVSLTGALFGFNDTAGTELAFRGWALHDEKATAFSHQPLPPLNGFMRFAQAAQTRPVIEIDNRVGFYAKAGVTLPKMRLQALYYDNRGDPQAVTDTLQWGWRTRFVNVGTQWKPADGTTISAQGMAGTTRMGFPLDPVNDPRIWVDTKFRSAFLLATQQLMPKLDLSARAEAFGTRGRGSVEGVESSEDGWAGTLAAKLAINAHATAIGEVLHVSSRRAERIDAGLGPRETVTTGQIALRLTL